MISDAEFDEFLNAGLKAVSRFADDEFEKLARKVEYRLRRMPGGEHRNFWLAYCEEMQRGPSFLRDHFDFDIEKIIDFIVSELPHRQAVLLTIAAMWKVDALEGQDGDAVAPDLIRDQVFDAVRQRALDEEHDWITG